MVKDAVPLASVARVLVVKLRHLGDVLLAAPVLSVLKARAPGAEIDALVYDDTAPMLRRHPALAQLHTVGRRWRKASIPVRLRAEWSLYAALAARRYDLLVHLSGHWRGAWLARVLAPAYSVAPIVPGRGALWARSFTHLYPVVGGGRRHQVELNLDALRRIGIQPQPEERRVRFLPGPEAERSVEALLAEHGLEVGAFVHMHPASRWRFKCWPAKQNAELLLRLAAEGHRVVLTSAPEKTETAFVGEIAALAEGRAVNLAGRLTIEELGALVARARLFIGVDSMPMHLASAMGTPTVALFGPSGEREWGPWLTAHRVVTSDHPCRPCGYDGCGGGKASECLTTIPVETVHAAARALLD
ncbi:MAG: putative lipopolysaccharide heptosyltransferase III [Burkholderiales bacterium]|nr:putative lipopolysaccharide heptosyltransferase III [Burkholderiales bacterium]